MADKVNNLQDVFPYLVMILFLVLTTSFNQRTALKVELPKAQAGTVVDPVADPAALADELDV